MKKFDVKKSEKRALRKSIGWLTLALIMCVLTFIVFIVSSSSYANNIKSIIGEAEAEFGILKNFASMQSSIIISFAVLLVAMLALYIAVLLTKSKKTKSLLMTLASLTSIATTIICLLSVTKLTTFGNSYELITSNSEFMNALVYGIIIFLGLTFFANFVFTLLMHLFIHSRIHMYKKAEKIIPAREQKYLDKQAKIEANAERRHNQKLIKQEEAKIHAEEVAKAKAEKANTNLELAKQREEERKLQKQNKEKAKQEKVLALNAKVSNEVSSNVDEEIQPEIADQSETKVQVAEKGLYFKPGRKYIGPLSLVSIILMSVVTVAFLVLAIGQFASMDTVIKISKYGNTFKAAKSMWTYLLFFLIPVISISYMVFGIYLLKRLKKWWKLFGVLSIIFAFVSYALMLVNTVSDNAFRELFIAPLLPINDVSSVSDGIAATILSYWNIAIDWYLFYDPVTWVYAANMHMTIITALIVYFVLSSKKLSSIIFKKFNKLSFVRDYKEVFAVFGSTIGFLIIVIVGMYLILRLMWWALKLLYYKITHQEVVRTSTEVTISYNEAKIVTFYDSYGRECAKCPVDINSSGRLESSGSSRDYYGDYSVDSNLNLYKNGSKIAYLSTGRVHYYDENNQHEFYYYDIK